MKSSNREEEEETNVRARITRLPSKALVDLWETLIYDEPIPARLLRYITRMMTLMKNPDLKQNIVNWNRLLLLHGPPGTGKTTLCRALAQKLAIRLGKYFTRSRLVELNSHLLLSKWFGESSKLVERLFENVQTIADDDATLVCVIIDEVETLTVSRDKAAHGSECGDAMRATNQLLTALDRLRGYSNVMVFCTSNLISTIDPAFLDRVDVKQHVPNPCRRATYDILRSCLNELIRCGLVTNGESVENETGETSNDEVSLLPVSGWELVDTPSIPTHTEMNVQYWNRPDSVPRKLWTICERCEGLSGRTLRRLPFLALALHTNDDHCNIQEALTALSISVGEELHGSIKKDLGT
ncbi:AAA-domain-containing protein [Patellaria atrata CBS 101060]|uniref:AAA-domain-containing protein n=1 Tax=Patellaria atrata CBS 101060 TaxID=1346257 RepID=A0A9P4SI54_9PEZI|nr:AAA-domain-containing protein [Patellaria atrata CBS 101060]